MVCFNAELRHLLIVSKTERLSGAACESTSDSDAGNWSVRIYARLFAAFEIDLVYAKVNEVARAFRAISQKSLPPFRLDLGSAAGSAERLGLSVARRSFILPRLRRRPTPNCTQGLL